MVGDFTFPRGDVTLPLVSLVSLVSDILAGDGKIANLFFTKVKAMKSS